LGVGWDKHEGVPHLLSQLLAQVLQAAASLLLLLRLLLLMGVHRAWQKLLLLLHHVPMSVCVCEPGSGAWHNDLAACCQVSRGGRGVAAASGVVEADTDAAAG
jgi:hypothetical protein